MKDLNPQLARIFRIVHISNVPWILDHGGLQCANSNDADPNYVNIGNASLIDKRTRRYVPIPPGGPLSDYVPFYFTPFSIMMYNIKTGYGGITRRNNTDIVMLVSSIYRLEELGTPFVFTNQHAYAVDTEFYNDLQHLDEIDWPLLQRRDFKTDDNDPGKQLRYQAEALIHRYVPLEAILGIVCVNDVVKGSLESLLEQRSIELAVRSMPTWYF
jgi:ssDNA thymidine ADP-ribosyltransferase DarT-like protein